MTLRIDLNNTETMFPGGKVSGQVVISIQEDAYNCESIVVTFTGKGKVSWKEQVYVPNTCPVCSKHRKRASKSCSKYSYPSTSSTYCSRCKSSYCSGNYIPAIKYGRENYLNLYQVLKGKEGTGDILELPKGTSTFPFEMILPANIPPSLELPDGHVRYKINARVKRVWYKWDLDSSLPFTVKGHIDLNAELGVRNPVTRSETRTISLSTCYCPYLLSFVFPVDTGSGEVTHKFKLLRTGFIPGESIPFTLDLTNSTYTNVPSSTVSLIQTAKYFAEGATKSVDVTLSFCTGTGVSPGENKRWESADSLSVPNPCLLSRLDGCHIIGISYAVKLEVMISGVFIPNLITSVPIMIGSAGLSY